jgi:DNA polymerase-3 subunit delta
MAKRQSKGSKEAVIYPVYVVFGKDSRRVADAAENIIETVLADGDPQLSLSRYDGSETTWADVLDELRTLPFLSERRLVMVKGADKFISTYRQAIEDYLEKPSDSGVLLLIAESFPGNTRLAKRVKEMGQTYDCGIIKGNQIRGYLTDYARKRYNLTLQSRAVDLLIDLAGEDSSVLLGEIDKLALFVADPKAGQTQITAQDVESLVGHNRQYSVFNVIDAITACDSGRALNCLDQLLAQDRDAEYSAVGAFAWHFRRLYKGRLLMEKRVAQRDIIKQLRIWSQPDLFIRQVQKFNIRAISMILRLLADIDYASKTGRGTVKTGLEKLIVQCCQ